ncbi:MAG TPA: GAF domain-containing protein [bacterium]|nr:GAF domain-containing protein [bacterium]
MERGRRIVGVFARGVGPQFLGDAERRIALLRLAILFALLPILRWDVIEPEAELVLTGLTALIAAYILAALLVLPRLRRELRKDLFLTIDIVAIAALVWFTGGVRSTLLFLFYLPILAAAVRLDLAQAILSAIGVSAVVVWMWTTTQGPLPSLASSTLRVGLFMGGSLMLALVFGILAQESRLLRERAELNRRLSEQLSASSEQLRRRLGELEAVYDLARRLAATAGAEAVLALAAETARQLLQAPRAGVFLAPGTTDLVVAHTVGADEAEAAGILAACAERVPREPPEPVPVAAEGGRWARAVAIPMVVGDRLIGVLCAGGGADWTPARHSVAALGQIACQAALALDRAWLLEDLQRLSSAKPEARVFDAGQFEQIVRAEITRATRLGSPFALLKVVLRGPTGEPLAAGAQIGLVERHFAAHVLKAIRRADVVARAGPGEIFVLLSTATLGAAEKFAARLLDQIDDDAVLLGLLGATGAPDVRVGIAIFPDDAVTAPELTHAVQNALDAADGAHRVVRARDLDATHRAQTR